MTEGSSCAAELLFCTSTAIEHWQIHLCQQLMMQSTCLQVFSCPEDKIIFDVGHQAYPHKILTNRRSRMSTIRQTGGLSGG